MLKAPEGTDRQTDREAGHSTWLQLCPVQVSQPERHISHEEQLPSTSQPLRHLQILMEAPDSLLRGCPAASPPQTLPPTHACACTNPVSLPKPPKSREQLWLQVWGWEREGRMEGGRLPAGLITSQDPAPSAPGHALPVPAATSLGAPLSYYHRIIAPIKC